MPFTAGRTARLSLIPIHPTLPHDPIGIGSNPALAAAIRRTHRRMEIPGSMRSLLRNHPVVQIYRVAPGSTAGSIQSKAEVKAKIKSEITIEESVQSEAQSAAHMLVAVADRLRRLRGAYGAWRHFDACAYFDLTAPQLERLVQVHERVTMVHVLFYADALLPSFQSAEAFWQENFRPDYLDLRYHLRNGDYPLSPMMAFADRSQPQMLEHWQRLQAVIRATRALLDNEVGYWAANGSSDERARWRWAWATDPAPGIHADLLPSLAQTPTLTLAVDFPLPTYRQPGRRRRLAERRNRGRRRFRSG